MDAENEFFGGKRLGHVVIGAEFEAGDPVIQFTAGGEHDDGDLTGTGVAPKVLENPETVPARQHQVQNNQIWLVLLGQKNSRESVPSRQNFQTLPLQVKSNQIENVGFVINNENSMHAGLW